MIIFLYGTDTYRSLEKLKQMRERFQREVDQTGSSIETIEGNELDLAFLRKVVLAPSLFTKNRFITFKNVLQSKPNKDTQTAMIELLSEYANDEESNVLIFWEDAGSKALRGLRQQKPLFDFLSEQKFVYELDTLPVVKLRAWVEKKLQDYTAKIEHDALAQLVQLLGQDMWRLAREVEKLGSMRYGGVITREDVAAQVYTTHDENVFALLDAIAAHKTQEALRLLEDFLQQTDGANAVFNTIKWQCNALAALKLYSEHGATQEKELAKLTGMHPFVVKKNLQRAQHMSHDMLTKLLDRITAIEIDLRRQTAPADVLLTRLVYGLSKV